MRACARAYKRVRVRACSHVAVALWLGALPLPGSGLQCHRTLVGATAGVVPSCPVHGARYLMVVTVRGPKDESSSWCLLQRCVPVKSGALLPEGHAGRGRGRMWLANLPPHTHPPCNTPAATLPGQAPPEDHP